MWAPRRKLFSPPGVPSWLRAWAKPSDIDPEVVIDELFKKKRRLNFIF